jgi:hypothetical protein
MKRSSSPSTGRPSPARRLPFVATMVAVVAVFLMTAAGTGLADPWQGEETTKDGVVHVMSPATPSDGTRTADLEELWRIGGDTDVEEEFFGVISRVTTDKEGQIYLLDSQLSEVKVFDQDGSYVRTIGREGEGPGEFRNPSDMFFVPGGNIGIMQMVPGKIVLLTPEGDPAGEYPVPAPADGAFQLFFGGRLAGEQLALNGGINTFAEGSFTQTRYLALIDKNGKETVRLHEEPREMSFADMVFDDTQWDTFDRRWTVGSDNRIYACLSHPNYEVTVWSPQGKEERVIERKYEHRKRTAEEMERIKGIYSAFTRQVPNAQIKISEWDKDVNQIFTRDDGSLWVLTSRGENDRPDGSLGVFDVFDAKGHYVRQVTLRGEGNPQEDGYFFVKDRLYVVTGFLDAAIAAQGGGTEDTETEVEPDPMAVICYRLDPSKLSMK